MNGADSAHQAFYDLLLKRNPVPPLVPAGVWDTALSAAIRKLKVTVLARGCLFLLNDDLDAAHRIAQESGTETGCLLHGIMHRREPDYPNSKYWLRQVSRRHPVWLRMRRAWTGWDALEFVDECASCLDVQGSAQYAKLCLMQLRELDFLLSFCLENGTCAKDGS